MINLYNLNQSKPYKVFYNLYKRAVKHNQENIEAINISSYDLKNNEVNSRYLNLKYIKNDQFVFFTNYESPKAIEFYSHPQITVVFFWNSINVQIRLKGNVSRLSDNENDMYFKNRDFKKNAIAISSHQSKKISSYSKVLQKYDKALISENLLRRPKHWGGFSFKPYYFEFWHGHDSRINKREVFNNIDGVWKHSFLQP